MPRYRKESDTEAIERLLENLGSAAEAIAAYKKEKEESKRSEEYLSLAKSQNERADFNLRREIGAENKAAKEAKTQERMDWAQAQEARFGGEMTAQSQLYEREMGKQVGPEVAKQKKDVMNRSIGVARSRDEVLALRDKMNKEMVDWKMYADKMFKPREESVAPVGEQAAPPPDMEISFDDKVNQFHMARRNLMTKIDPTSGEDGDNQTTYTADKATEIALDVAGFTDEEIQRLAGTDKSVGNMVNRDKAMYGTQKTAFMPTGGFGNEPIPTTTPAPEADPADQEIRQIASRMKQDNAGATLNDIDEDSIDKAAQALGVDADYLREKLQEYLGQ